MTKRYTGGVVSSSLPTVNAAGASGVFNLSQQADAQTKNNWPPFKVEKSLRFRAAGSAYLTRTPSSAGNQMTWTWSGWVKYTGTDNGTYNQNLFGCVGGSFGNSLIMFSQTNNSPLHQIQLYNADSVLRTKQVFRDPSAWYHIVCVVDNTQSTSSERSKIYVNGVRVTTFESASYPSQNAQGNVNSVIAHEIGRQPTTSRYFDGYLSEVNFVDGQALTPSSFGGTDKDGNWSPITYTGTYGQNGFYLNFKDATSTSTIGYDYSGNGNNWTASGFNVTTANTSYDSVIDVPSDQASSNVRSNYATLNYADPFPGTMSNGNLTHYIGSNDFASSRSTIGMKGGKWYWEAKCETNLGANFYMGIGICSDSGYNAAGYPGQTNYGYNYDGRATKVANGGSSSSYGATYTNGDIIGVAFDSDNGTLEYYKNGSSQGVAFTGIPTTETFYANHWVYTTQISYNFGQQGFVYTPPSGYKPLCTYNLAEPTIKQPNKHFDATLYAGTSVSQSITNAAGFKPDLVWGKNRTSINSHRLTDSVRGVGKVLFSDTTSADTTGDGQLSSFNSNGFSLTGGAGAFEGLNESSKNYVAWQWKGASSNTTNTDGTITSNVCANPTAGFSVVGYTTQSSGTGTVGHGLGVAPSMIILKNRSLTNNWIVYHKSLGASAYLYLNTSAVTQSDSSVFNGTDPTSSVFTMGSGEAGSLLTIAYCFSQIEGYSKFGTYTGNGSTNGPFVYTGFRPKYLMIKCTSNAAVWYIWDSARDTYNYVSHELYANLSDAEYNNSAEVDFLSNGFKMRSTFADQNGSARTYIYAAFAEMPFKYARSR